MQYTLRIFRAGRASIGGMLMSEDSDLDRLIAYVQVHAPIRRDAPRGWPDDVELALIDAVLSIRSRYGVSETTGVRGAIGRYKSASHREGCDNLEALANTQPEWLERVLDNKQRTGGVSKSEAIVSAAQRLTLAGVVHASDVDPTSADQRRAYCGTKGLGPVTWAYFLMLVGNDGVKADTLLTRFVASALGRDVGYETVTKLVAAAARRLDISSAAMDHSIWRSMSKPRRS